MTSRRKTTLIAAGALATLALGGAAFVQASGDDGEARVSGPQAERASSAALRITDGGTANSVERDGENGATWEVEVTKADGSTVDVRLDESYGLVVVEGDDEDSDSGAAADAGTIMRSADVLPCLSVRTWEASQG